MRRPRWTTIVLALGLIAAVAVATPVFGISTSVKKMIRKEVSRQLAKRPVVPGPQGERGTQGPEGPEGRQGDQGTSGPSPVMGVITGVSGSQIQYAVPGGRVAAGSSDDGTERVRSPNAPMVARDLSVNTAPPMLAGQSRQVTLLVNGAETAVSCTVTAATVQTCESNGTANVPPGSTLSFKLIPNGSPSGGIVNYGVRLTAP